MSSSFPPSQPTVQMATAPKPTVWPTVVGIIAIIFGSLGAVNNGLCAPVGLVLSGSMGGLFDKLAESQPGAGMEEQAAMMDALQDYLPANLAVSITAAILSLILLIGGIGLVKRRAWCIRTIVIWALLKMIHAVPAMAVGYLLNSEMFRAMEEAAETSSGGPGQMPAGFDAMIKGFSMAGVLIGMLWAWALPMFMLIWFARAKIRQEVTSWRSEINEQFSPHKL